MLNHEKNREAINCSIKRRDILYSFPVESVLPNETSGLGSAVSEIIAWRELFDTKDLEAITAKVINTGVTIKIECPMEHKNQLIDMMYDQGWRTKSSGPKRIAEHRYDIDYYEAEFYKQI